MIETMMICLARKPLEEKTITANVMEHGTGGINIKGCRITCDDFEKLYVKPSINKSFAIFNWSKTREIQNDDYKDGRFPANIMHDGSDEVKDKMKKHNFFFEVEEE